MTPLPGTEPAQFRTPASVSSRGPGSPVYPAGRTELLSPGQFSLRREPKFWARACRARTILPSRAEVPVSTRITLSIGCASSDQATDICQPNLFASGPSDLRVWMKFPLDALPGTEPHGSGHRQRCCPGGSCFPDYLTGRAEFCLPIDFSCTGNQRFIRERAARTISRTPRSTVPAYPRAAPL